MPSAASPGKKERLAGALDSIGLLDRLFWLRGKLGVPVLTVLTYHRVAEEAEVGELDGDVVDARPDAFRQHLEVIGQHCHPVTTADLVAFRNGKGLPPNAAMIAFDDGYMDCRTVALPLLQKAGIPASFFIPTAYPDAGKLFWWDRVAVLVNRCKKDRIEIEYPERAVIELGSDRAPAVRAATHLVKNTAGVDPARFLEELERATGVRVDDAEEREIAARTILGMEDVRALRDAGMDVQSHSHSHRVLDTLSPEEARADLRRSRELLADALGAPVHSVAYPVGYTLRGRYRRVAEESGFSIGFTNSSGLCRLDGFDPFSVSRLAMGTEHTGAFAKLVMMVGDKPHRLHDAKLRLFTGERGPALARERVTSVAALHDLLPEWRELEARAAARSPTTAPDWMLAWWRTFGDTGGRRIASVAVREGERLVGLAPLLERRHWYPPALPYRRLELMASGEDEADEIVSEYIGIVAERGYEAAVAQAVAAALVEEGGGWDELVMPLMDGSSPVPGLLADALRDHGLVVAVTPESEAPYIELPSSWERYLAALTSEKRYFVQRTLRDFDKWAGPDVSYQRATDPATLDRGLAVLSTLHGERWREQRAGGAFASRRFDAFHRTVTPALLEQGALDLSWMTVRGEPVAALYSIVWDGKVHFYQSGRSQGLPKNVRPGIVLHTHAIRRAIEAGLREYDFLGGASQYKTRLATATRTLVGLRATRSAALETARGLGRAGVAELRRLVSRVRPSRARPSHP